MTVMDRGESRYLHAASVQARATAVQEGSAARTRPAAVGGMGVLSLYLRPIHCPANLAAASPINHRFGRGGPSPDDGGFGLQECSRVSSGTTQQPHLIRACPRGPAAR